MAGRTLNRWMNETRGIEFDCGGFGGGCRPCRAGENGWVTFPGPALRSSPGCHIAGLQPSGVLILRSAAVSARPYVFSVVATPRSAGFQPCIADFQPADRSNYEHATDSSSAIELLDATQAGSTALRQTGSLRYDANHIRRTSRRAPQNALLLTGALDWTTGRRMLIIASRLSAATADPGAAHHEHTNWAQ